LKRIELLVNDPVYNDYMQRIVAEELEPKYCQHNFNHHIDVARIAYILVLEHGDMNYFVREHELNGRLPAKEVIYAAGLLHDIGKWKEYRSGTDHASFGAGLAREILPQAFFDDNEIEIISRAIYEHPNISTVMSFLGERLHRADNLSRVCSQCEYGMHCPKRIHKESHVNCFEY
jgi:uncharacterized protein